MWAPGRGRGRVMARGGELRAYNEGLPHVGACTRGDVPEPPAPVCRRLWARGPRRVPGPEGGGGRLPGEAARASRIRRGRDAGCGGRPDYTETSPRPVKHFNLATRPKRPRAAAYADEARALDVRGASVPCRTGARTAPGSAAGCPPVHGDEWPQADHQAPREGSGPEPQIRRHGAAGARGRLCPMPPPRTRRPGPPARGPCSRLRTRAWNNPPSSLYTLRLGADRHLGARTRSSSRWMLGFFLRQVGKRADRMASFRIAHAPPIWPPILRRTTTGRTPPPRTGRRRPICSRAAVTRGAADVTQLATFSGHVSISQTVRAARVLHSALTAAPSVLP